MTRTTVSLGIIALLAGCATGTMDRIMTSWQGEHIDRVVERWGYPNAERNFRGKTLYVWNESSTYVLPSYSTTTGTVSRAGPGMAFYSGTTTTMPGGPITGVCERILEVDSAGRVVAWQWEGNNCCAMTVAGRCAAWPNPARQ